jgi:hypothetical protein
MLGDSQGMYFLYRTKLTAWEGIIKNPHELNPRVVQNSGVD